MVGRNRFFVAALGALAAVAVMSADADAATSYAGTGIGAGSAVQNWIAAVGTYNELVTPSGTGTGAASNPWVLPLGISSSVNMKLTSAGGTIATGVGTLNGTLTASPTVYQSSSANKGIILSNFSTSITAFGFFLESLTTYSTTLTITLTDGNGTSVITIPTVAADSITGTPLTNAAAEFIGFTGINNAAGTATITLSTGTGQRYEIGDFLSAPIPSPEPASLALLGAGLLGLGIARRRKSA